MGRNLATGELLGLWFVIEDGWRPDLTYCEFKRREV